MMKKIGINGLGRIGRLVLRHFIEYDTENIDIVAANDLASVEDLAYLLKYDSVFGSPSFDVGYGEGYLQICSKKISIYNKEDPSDIPWEKEDVDIILECTGLFRRREDSAKHLKAGASRVLISAPSESADLTVVLGVNESEYNPSEHTIISNASCTTNSLAPAVKVLDDAFNVRHLLVTTVHAYTTSQNLIDGDMRKRRRGRAAAINLVPTTTGAAKATELVLPKMKGKMDAMAIRSPVVDGAITDIVAEVEDDVSVEKVNTAFKNASKDELKGILDYTEEDLVSSDILGNIHSGIVDGNSTRVVDKNMAKVLVWYDNEAGYAKKLLELAEYVSKK